MVADKTNAGWAAGIGQSSHEKRIAWALKGAPLRKRDLRLTAMGGIAEGRKLRNRVTELMTRAELNPDDAMVLCLFAKEDLSALEPRMAVLPARDNGTDMRLLGEVHDKLPIGFLVFVLDKHDPERPVFGHARPLIVEDPRSLRMHEWALADYAARINARMAGN